MVLKDNIPNARIISFWYDADIDNWLPPTSTNRISNHAETMLSAAVRLAGKDAIGESEGSIHPSQPVGWWRK